MSEINKQEFYDLIEFALEEYNRRIMNESSILNAETVCKKFGSITAVISNVIADENNLIVSHYEILDENYEEILSFFIGYVTILFSVNTYSFREMLLNEHTIKGVITLKQSVFKNMTKPPAIILLDKSDEKTWFTSARNIDCLINNLLSKFDKKQKVYYSKHINVNNMMPERYRIYDTLSRRIGLCNMSCEVFEKKFFDESDEAYINGEDNYNLDFNINFDIEFESFLSQKYRSEEELREIATIISGKFAKREDFSKSGIPYLRAKDIKDGNIITPKNYIGLNKIDKFSKQLIQEGDIILDKNLGENKITLVTNKDMPAIISNGLLVIRPYGVTERYLYKYLISKTGNEAFNKHINSIQKGITLIKSSIEVSDLINFRVPIYDEEIMHSIETIDTLSKSDAIEVTKQLVQKYKFQPNLEEEVYNNFIEAGWNNDNLQKGVVIYTENGIRWIPDLLYKLPDQRKVYIGVKTNLSCVNKEWISAIKQILNGEEKCFFILTTGSYYEVHASGVEKSLILPKVPTIDEILKWEKEVR